MPIPMVLKNNGIFERFKGVIVSLWIISTFLFFSEFGWSTICGQFEQWTVENKISHAVET
jgi:hypothetical protein